MSISKLKSFVVENVILAYGFLTVCVLYWIDIFAFGVGSASDFMQDYGSAVALKNSSSIYGEAVTNWAKTLCESCIIENFHPPFVSVIMLPLSKFTYHNAATIYSITSLFIYIGMVFVLTKAKWPKLKLHIGYILGVSLLWHPFWSNTGSAQLSVFLAVLICWAGLRISRADDWFAGVLLACAAMIKLFPLAFVLYLFVVRRWMTLISMSLTILLLASVTVAVVGFEDVFFYLTNVMSRNVREWSSFPINQSLLGVLSILFYKSSYTTPLFQSSIAIESIHLPLAFLIIVGAALKARILFIKGHAEASYCLFTVAMLIASPISWSHGFVILLLPIAYLISNLPRSLWGKVFIIFAICLVSIPDLAIARFLYAEYYPQFMPWYVAILIKGPFLGLLFFYSSLFKAHLFGSKL